MLHPGPNPKFVPRLAFSGDVQDSEFITGFKHALESVKTFVGAAWADQERGCTIGAVLLDLPLNRREGEQLFDGIKSGPAKHGLGFFCRFSLRSCRRWSLHD